MENDEIMNKEGRDVEGGRCLRGSDGKLNFSEEDGGKVWKEHMERIMNEENEWDQKTEAGVVEGPVEKVSREEVVKAIREMKVGQAAGPSEVSVEMISASGYFLFIFLISKLMEMLGLEGRVEQLAKANGVRWYEHVLRREEDHVLRKALEFEVLGKRKRGRPKKKWRERIVEECERVDLGERDAFKSGKVEGGSQGGCYIWCGLSSATLVDGDKPDQNWL